jgi:hypothetical protein
MDQESPSCLPALQATASQLEAMEALQGCLTCTLCHAVATLPVSLGCGHFFCQVCIDNYAQNNWNCPGKYYTRMYFDEHERMNETNYETAVLVSKDRSSSLDLHYLAEESFT